MTAVGSTELQRRSIEHLRARMALLEARVRGAVARRRVSDPEPDNQFRGLYLSEAAVDDLLGRDSSSSLPPDDHGDAAALELQADAWELAGQELRLRSLARSFGLNGLDVEILIVALAPDLDPRFESLYGYLHDDVTRRRASVGLALELSGLSTLDADARARLSGHGPLVRHGLVEVEGSDRPLLSRGLRVRDRIASHLLGSDLMDSELAEVIAPVADDGGYAPIGQALAAGIRLLHLHEEGVAAGVAAAVGSVAALGAESIALDLRRLAAAPRPAGLIAEALREARLTAAVLVAGPLDALLPGNDGLIRDLAESGWPTVLVGRRPWDPAWSPTVPLLLDAPQPDAVERTERWHRALRVDPVTSNGHAAEFVQATMAFHLGNAEIDRAAEAGRLRALAEGRDMEPADLRAGARAQNSAGLERLAHRVAPSAGWDDLVLPPDVRAQLRELTARTRHRELVFDEWGIGGRSSRGHGITALFGGESGTGKTLAAEVIAGELGLDLYVIDLSTVIDKYIGETEKNLDRIFTEAARVNGVLLFDEADAIFGKRSEVRDARDRYANVEVAYLLQRMERFDGLAILTTNLRANLDEAFTRRLDVIVDFPMPDETARGALWRMHLPDGLPRAGDLDLDFMARRFRLSGGHVRNICLTAAFLAAERGAAVSMADLVRGTEREYRKLGRLTLEDEFGPYHAMVVADRQPVA
jgi:hypothetical protein